MGIRGKKALVTGGSRGIGRAIADKLVRTGVDVVITGRNPSTLKQTADELNASWMVWDITDISCMQSNFDQCVELLGGFDILVNNAGVLTEKNEWGMGMLNLTEDEWDRVINTNLKGAYFMMQTAVRYMAQNNIAGNVLNISSVAATEPYCGPYTVSKGGLTGLTRGWGKQMAPLGIVVNGIGPGPIATEMNHWHEGDSMEHKRIPTGRFGTTGEVADLAMYLLSEEANQIIGHTVIIDGAYDIK